VFSRSSFPSIAYGRSDECGAGYLSLDIEIGTSADEFLRGAQARYRVFYAPVVVKAFRMAEEAYKGQV